ncbi:MAG: FeoB-associated Cys-rich membrane protein [Opitutaceae bacterium]
MDAATQRIVALAIVALAAAALIARALRRRKRPGCDAGCACAPRQRRTE